MQQQIYKGNEQNINNLIDEIFGTKLDLANKGVPAWGAQGGGRPKGTTNPLETASSAIRPRAFFPKYSWTWVPRPLPHNVGLGLAATIRKDDMK